MSTDSSGDSRRKCFDELLIIPWFRIFGLGFDVWGLGFGIWDLVFKFWGWGFGLWGLGMCHSPLHDWKGASSIGITWSEGASDEGSTWSVSQYFAKNKEKRV